MNRLLGVLLTVLFLLILLPTVLAEAGRLLVPILARGAAGLILVLMVWGTVSLIRGRRFPRHHPSERRTDPWRF